MMLISRGYERRHRALWSAVRWQTYNIMSAIPYTDLTKAGIHNATDLLPLPWDSKMDEQISDKEKQDMLDEIAALNAAWSNE